jgi:hypothetical protein
MKESARQYNMLMKTIDAFARVSRVGGIDGFFPLTPALSLGERENHPPRYDKPWRPDIPSHGQRGTLSLGAVHSPQVLYSLPQSRRDCVLQPRVASSELPWVNCVGRCQPQRGCGLRSPLNRRNPTICAIWHWAICA